MPRTIHLHPIAYSFVTKSIHIMAKRLTRADKWDKAREDLINKMFEIAGHDVTFDDIKGRTDAWYTKWTMTVAQGEQWKEWGTEYIMKNLRLNKHYANMEMEMLNMMYGLKYSDFYGTEEQTPTA